MDGRGDDSGRAVRSGSGHRDRKTLTGARRPGHGAWMRTLLAIAICAFVAAGTPAQTAPAKPKIFISNSDDWQKAGGFKAKMSAPTDNGAPDSAHLNEVSAMAAQCSETEVTSDPSKANFILLWDTKALWNALSAKTNLLILYTPKGDAVYSDRADTMSSAARHVCRYIAPAAAKPAPKSGS
jgi:hypothetical protein